MSFVHALAGLGREDSFLTIRWCLDTSKSCDLACAPVSQTTAPVLMYYVIGLLINEMIHDSIIYWVLVV